MRKYQGNTEQVQKSDREVFEFLSDFRHFEKFLPEQIADWEATNQFCSFSVSGMGTIKLVYHTLEPFSKIIVQPSTDSRFPVPFFLTVHIEQQENNPSCSAFHFLVEADVNPMIGMMVDGPLKQFVEVITVRLSALLNEEQ
jgi:hypothetical protein